MWGEGRRAEEALDGGAAEGDAVPGAGSAEAQDQAGAVRRDCGRGGAVAGAAAPGRQAPRGESG